MQQQKQIQKEKIVKKEEEKQKKAQTFTDMLNEEMYGQSRCEHCIYSMISTAHYN